MEKSAKWRNLLLASLSLAILLGGLAYPGYRYVQVRVQYLRAITDPKAYEATFHRPGAEAEAWAIHLGKGTPLRLGEASLARLAYACYGDSLCRQSLERWAAAHPPQPWGAYYWIALLMVAALPLAFTRHDPVRKQLPAAGYLAGYHLIQERTRELAREGRKIHYVGDEVRKDSTFVGLISKKNPEEILQREPQAYAYLQLPSGVRERHILVVAGTGAGKTSTYAYNQILSSARNGMGCIVIDQKWGDESGLAWSIPIYAYHRRPIYVFAPFSPTTMRLPLLDGISTEDTTDAMEFAQMIVPGSDDLKVQHYRENDWAILAALVMAEIDHARREGRSPDLGRIVELLSLESKAGLEAYTQINPLAKVLAAKVFNRPPQKLDETIPALRNKLLPFLQPVVRRATTRGRPEENLDLAKILQEPALLYVGLPQHKVKMEDGKVLLRILKHYIDRHIFSQGRLPVPYNFILDEFANFGHLPNMDHNLALIRSKGVSMHIILQSVEQAEKVYTKEGWRAIARNNFNTEIWYLGDLSPEVQEELAEKIGETTIYTESFSESRSSPMDFVPKTGYSLRAAKAPVISREQMYQAKPGSAVVRLPYVGWVPFRAVPPFDPRNPFHREWEESRRLARHLAAAARRRREAMGREELPRPSTRPTALEGFSRWLETLLEERAPLKVHRGQEGRIARVDILYLPPSLVPEEWMEGKLVRMATGGVIFLPSQTLQSFPELLPSIEEAAERRRLVESAFYRGEIALEATGSLPEKKALADIASGKIYVPASLEELHRASTPLPSPPPFLAKAGGQWGVIEGGRFLYGLLAHIPDGEKAVSLAYAETLKRREPITPA